MLSSEEYSRKGYQIDLDMMNLDTAIQRLYHLSPSTIPAVEKTNWDVLKLEWDNFFNKNIKNPPFFPLQSEDELNTWLQRITDWKKKSATWALASNNSTARALVAAMPSSPAQVEFKENPPSKKSWVVPISIGLIGIFGFAYLLSSAAKLKGSF